MNQNQGKPERRRGVYIMNDAPFVPRGTHFCPVLHTTTTRQVKYGACAAPESPLAGMSYLYGEALLRFSGYRSVVLVVESRSELAVECYVGIG